MWLVVKLLYLWVFIIEIYILTSNKSFFYKMFVTSSYPVPLKNKTQKRSGEPKQPVMGYFLYFLSGKKMFIFRMFCDGDHA